MSHGPQTTHARRSQFEVTVMLDQQPHTTTTPPHTATVHSIHLRKAATLGCLTSLSTASTTHHTHTTPQPTASHTTHTHHQATPPQTTPHHTTRTRPSRSVHRHGQGDGASADGAVVAAIHQCAARTPNTYAPLHPRTPSHTARAVITHTGTPLSVTKRHRVRAGTKRRSDGGGVVPRGGRH